MTQSHRLLNLLAPSLVAFTFVFQLTSLYVLLLNPLTFALTPDPHRYHDYCVIGAGPAGLQIGYFLKKANRDYVVFERSNVSGNFFVTYPRHRKLISINKRYTGKTNKEFNLRHDWNSILSDDESLLFREYSKEMFPHADRIVDYLRDYQQKLGVNVQFNTEISNIHSVHNASAPDGVLHYMNDQNGNEHSCKVVVMATGMWKPNIPDMPGIEHALGYETMSLNPDDYEGKTVLILGRGNSAFEVADGIYGVTNLIHMVSRSRVRLSWETHYVGDLRAVNNALLDTYQLKSLDGLLEAGLSEVMLQKHGDKLTVEPKDKKEEDFFMVDNFAMREPYDTVIRCLGFKFDTSVFGNETGIHHGHGRAKKFLPINHNYELKSKPGIFIAGTASHSLDFRKSAGGFIHGFRYTARALFHLLQWRYEGVPWPSQNLQVPVTQLMSHLLKRMNEASGPYQMFQVLGDVAVFSEDGRTFDYFEEFPINLLHEFFTYTGRPASRVLVAVLEYGPDFSGPGKDIFRYDRATGDPSEAHTSNFLHPVLYYYKMLPTERQMSQRTRKEVLPRPDAMHHIVEDFLTSWDGPESHVAPLRHFLDHVTSLDLRQRFAQPCFLEAMTHGQPSPACVDQYMQGQGLTATPDMIALGRKSGTYPF
ncbi:FAD-dependent oxidoreductase domain-containing protein 2-like [Babylonia areolata]|uniref:FAD-dependent oxidoreductase domain-containing protein 2-like n=1 Tax=Babylonia areolata TaxID=304850 RepID=UPI003FCF2A25